MGGFGDAARDLAANLDFGNEDLVGQKLSAYAQQLSREDFKQLLSTVDQVEKDGVGLDLVLKRDGHGTPTNYAVIPNQLHQSARDMAGLMDSGREVEAEQLMQKATGDIFRIYPRDEAMKKYGLWAMAVDAYERDGVGVDVTIDKTKPGIEGIAWLRNNGSVGDSASAPRDNVSIPALIRGQEATEGSVANVPKGSPLAVLYDKVSPCVTQIIATRPGKIPGTTETSYGSGFIVGGDGLIGTNNHTFYGFSDITVKTVDGQSYKATVAAQDPVNDVGLLKITPPAGKQFRTLELEPDSKNISMPQKLTAFGHPRGWGKTYVSEGTVDGATTIAKVAKSDPPEENPNKQVIAIQAHGEDGGSGGPVINESGRVAGLAELASDSQRGQHIFMTPIQHLNALIARYRTR